MQRRLAYCLGAGIFMLAPSALADYQVKKVDNDLSKPDPLADFWDKIPREDASMMGQPMTTPKADKTNTDKVSYQIVHDGRRIAIRLQWLDPEKSESGRLAEYSDGAAVEFPFNNSDSTPVMMGAVGFPVHIFHWRAQYQHDVERGKPEMKELYPNMSVDMYNMQINDWGKMKPRTEEDWQIYNPAKAWGNPQSYPKKSVDEIYAEGFGSSAVQENRGSDAVGIWDQGQWKLTIVRPLEVKGGSILTKDGKSFVGFAVWQGGKDEVGGRKSLTMMWTPIQMVER